MSNQFNPGKASMIAMAALAATAPPDTNVRTLPKMDRDRGAPASSALPGAEQGPTHSCVLHITDAETGETMLLVKVDKGNKPEMDRLGDMLHNNPNLAQAKGMHLYGAALAACYQTRGVKFASEYRTAAI